MLRNLRIPIKFPLVIICFALISALVMGATVYRSAVTVVKQQSTEKLVSLLESRTTTLNRHFSSIENNLLFHARSDLVVDALQEFQSSWDQIDGSPKAYLQRQYIDLNPFSIGQEFGLLAADDGSQYSLSHRKYHSPFVSLIGTDQFHDILMISPGGEIIYTVKKESDFAANVSDRPDMASLADLFGRINQAQSLSDQPRTLLAFSDFTHYGPSNRQLAGFVASPVFDENAKYLGVLAFQISIEAINAIMHVKAGMGETGEIYLVGSDNLMRSDSRFIGSRSILSTTVDTSSVEFAFEGRDGVHFVEDYRGIPVLSAFTQVDIMGVNWAVVAEMDKQEVLAPVYDLALFLILAGIAVILAVTILGYLLATDLSHPIVTMTGVLNSLAKNDLNVNVSVAERRDEIGQMANALVEFKELAIEREQLKQELIHMSQHDSLTGLPNRSYAVSFLDGIVRQSTDSGRQFAVIFADLDGFKQINDLLGHGIGDQVLTELGNRFRYLMQGRDMPCRLGGDEFCFILPDRSSTEECERLAKKLLEACHGLFTLADHDCRIRMSIGIALFPIHSNSAGGIMNSADLAMYQAKKGGKNSYVWATVQSEGASDADQASV